MRKRRSVTETEIKAMLARRAEGATPTELAREFKRARSFIHKLLKTHAPSTAVGGRVLAASRTVQMKAIGTSLENASAQALERGTRDLLELLSREAPEIDTVTVDVRSRTIKAVVRRALDIKV